MKNKIIMESTATQKLLSFLSSEPGSFYTPAEAVKKTTLSRRGFYLAVKELQEMGYVVQEDSGKYAKYGADYKNPFIRQFKVAKNVAALCRLIKALEPAAIKVILFGSVSRGEDTAGRDIDLFIVASDPGTVSGIIAAQKSSRKIKPVIKTPSEIPDFMEKEKVFYNEVQKGIVLLERL